MPADYSSTARALSLPVSPPPSPSSHRNNRRPSWSFSRPTAARVRSHSPYLRGRGSLKEKVLYHAEQTQQQVYKIYKMMSWWQRILALVSLAVMFVMGMLFLVYNERIFAWLAPVAKKWRDLPAGWLIIFAMTFICAFPPVIGYSTTLTIAGFVYGFPIGWFIVASATVVGSFCAFLTSRTIFSTYAQRLVANDTRFNALALTLKHDGLKLLIMIRYCPLPYSLSNGAMSTFPTVHPLMFTLATAISTPRAIIPIFIGGRLAQLAEKGEKMDAKTKAINYASIAIGGLIGLAVGWFIYQRTVARSRQLEAQERAGLAEQRNSASGGHFLDEPEDDINEANLRGADDISLFENFPEEEAFHDESSDEQEVVHDHRKRDEEELIGMDRDPANTGT